MKFANYYLRKEKENEWIKEREREEASFAFQTLSFFDRHALNRIQSMIDKITYKIVQESGWEYRGYSFVLPTNFHLQKEEIVFSEHSINHPYVFTSGMNEEEAQFLEKYSSLLSRLSHLEEKKEHYIQKAKEMYPNVTLFKKKTSNRKKNENYLSALGFIEREADQFAITYSVDGISKLVSILNVIGNSRDVADAYQKIQGMRYAYSYMRDILRWASVFSKRGNILYEKYVDDHQRIVLEESPITDSFMKDESDLILYYRNRKK